MIRSPEIQELTDFPLIGELPGVGNNPMKLLQAWCETPAPWVTPKQDSYWFAVGMTVTAFDILKITAAALLAFRDSGVIVSLYADAVAQMPPGVTDTSQMILYVEIGLVAEMNFIDCYFRCEASLAPTSFLLVPECQLYGGFALCYWFGDNPHSGDWVFSVGGYHRSFQVPSHYPTPKRLGISFTVGDMVHIQGEGYFAITPKAVMGGAMIHVSLQVGIVSAYLDASFDALIVIEPLHYTADLHIAIGVSCDIDILFIHIHISVSIGADLHIEGPAFGGVAHVDFWVFGFDVYFGEHGEAPEPMTLEEFYTLVHRAGPQTGRPPATGPETATLDQPIKLTLEDGAFPMPTKDKDKGDANAQPDSTGASSKWFVKGGSFAFRAAPDFALSTAEVLNEKNTYDTVVSPPQGDGLPVSPQPKPLYSWPMHLDEDKKTISSKLTVTIRSKADDKPAGTWKSTYVIKDVPSALWAVYNPKSDLLDPTDSTVKQIMGVSIAAPDPDLAISPMPAFNAADAQRSPVLSNTNGPWIMPTPGLDQTIKLLPAPVLDAVDGVEPDKPKIWSDMKSTWQKLSTDGLDLSTEMAALCATKLGWDAPLPGLLVGPKITDASDGPAWMLKTALPKRLVIGTKKEDDPVLRDVMDGFENFYLALPRVATAA